MQMNALIARIRNNLPPNVVAKAHTNPFVEEESKRFISELERILDKMEQDSFNQDVTEENIKPLMDLLAEREQRINHDKIPVHAFDTLANRISVKIDKLIHELQFKPIFQSLKPSLQILRNDYSNISQQQITLQGIVFSDDGKYAIEVFPCLERLAKSKTNKDLEHTVLINGKREKLSESEASRVIYYCQESKDWYEKIMQYKNKNKDVPGDVLYVGYAFNRKLNEENKCEPLYHATDVMFLVKDFFKNKEELANFLQKLPHGQWEEFLKTIELQKLREFLLNGRKFKEAVADMSSYNKDPNHNRAMLYLYDHLLREEYAACEREYMGSRWGYKKIIKQNESSIPHHFLLSNQPLENYENHYAQSEHTGASDTGNLHALNNQICVVAKLPNQTEENTNTIMSYLSRLVS